MRRVRSRYTPRSLRRQEAKSKRSFLLTLFVSGILLFAIFNWGLPFVVGSLSVFNKFKPVSKEGVGLENSTLAPPVLNIPFEATGSATIKVTGFSTPETQVMIYIDDVERDNVKTNEEGYFETSDLELALGINNIYGKSVDSENKESLASKTIQVIYRSEKPKLEVTEPEDNKEVKGGDKKVRISGISDLDSDVTINGTKVIVNSEGKFTYEASLNDGDNNFTISATDPVGNSTTVTRRVTYTP